MDVLSFHVDDSRRVLAFSNTEIIITDLHSCACTRMIEEIRVVSVVDEAIRVPGFG